MMISMIEAELVDSFASQRRQKASHHPVCDSVSRENRAMPLTSLPSFADPPCHVAHYTSRHDHSG
jgi:hypothetical protein